MINKKQAMLDPPSVFDTPDDVVDTKDLSLEEKLSILKRWEYDARELAVADEENMCRDDDKPNLLELVLKAMLRIEENPDLEGGSTTKQGG